MLTHFLRAAALKPISFVESTTSTGGTITLPNNITSKDLLIFFDCARNASSTTPSLVSPSGWTLIENQSQQISFSNRVRAATWYRAGDPSLSGTTVTGMDAGTDRKICMMFRNAQYSSYVSGYTSFNATASTASLSLISTGSAQATIIFVAGDGSAYLTTVQGSPLYTPASSGTVFAAYYLEGITGGFVTTDSGAFTVINSLALNLNNI